MSTEKEKVVVENINVPGHTTRVNAEKYHAAKKAYLKILPKTAPGLTQKECVTRSIPHLPESLFPGGTTAGWWMKTVQLDLEAKGIVRRENSKPLRWHKV